MASSKAMAPKRSAIPPPNAPKPGCTALFLGRPFGLPDGLFSVKRSWKMAVLRGAEPMAVYLVRTIDDHDLVGILNGANEIHRHRLDRKSTRLNSSHT